MLQHNIRRALVSNGRCARKSYAFAQAREASAKEAGGGDEGGVQAGASPGSCEARGGDGSQGGSGGKLASGDSVKVGGQKKESKGDRLKRQVLPCISRCLQLLASCVRCLAADGCLLQAREAAAAAAGETEQAGGAVGTGADVYVGDEAERREHGKASAGWGQRVDGRQSEVEMARVREIKRREAEKSKAIEAAKARAGGRLVSGTLDQGTTALQRAQAEVDGASEKERALEEKRAKVGLAGAGAGWWGQ